LLSGIYYLKLRFFRFAQNDNELGNKKLFAGAGLAAKPPNQPLQTANIIKALSFHAKRARLNDEVGQGISL
jgi:hypothetical protein